MSNLVLITAAAAEPVTSTEAKAQLRITSTDEDTKIAQFIAAARARCESVTGRALINQTWELRMDDWPYWANLPAYDRYAILIEKPPVSSITSVKYIDADGVEQTLVSGTDYSTSLADPITRITPYSGTTWPTVKTDTPDAVKVRFVTGYGAASTAVPEDLRAGILMLIDHFYRNRADEISGAGTSKFDTCSQSIFQAHAIRMVA